MAQKVDYAALKKGGYMRQKQKGYGSLRLAVIGGNLTAENIKKVAEVAEKYGRGYVHMTSRQGIEIPFIKVEELAEVKEELAKGGVGTGVCGPRVRTTHPLQIRCHLHVRPEAGAEFAGTWLSGRLPPDKLEFI